MEDVHIRSAAAIVYQPIYPMLAMVPLAFFTMALVLDIAYWSTSNLTWKHFAEWLLLAGLITGAIAGIAGAVELLPRREVGIQPLPWPHAIGIALVLILGILNSLIHARDGWTGVVPWGLTLSVMTVLVALVTTWLNREVIYRHSAPVTSTGVIHNA